MQWPPLYWGCSGVPGHAHMVQTTRTCAVGSRKHTGTTIFDDLSPVTLYHKGLRSKWRQQGHDCSGLTVTATKQPEPEGFVGCNTPARLYLLTSAQGPYINQVLP
jgi:hypothetical protein